MAFTQINKSSLGSHSNKNEIRMGSRRQSQSVPQRSIYFAITRDVVAQVGWELTVDDDDGNREWIRVAVNEGSDEDAGFLLLTEDMNKGYVFGTNKGATGFSLAGSVSCTRFKHYVLNDTTMDIEPAPVEFTVDEKEHSILIQCPDWLRYNPLSVPAVAKPKPVVKEVVAPVAKPTFPKGKAAILEARRAASFDELAEKVSANPEVMELLNRQERRTINKKMQQHLRR